MVHTAPVVFYGAREAEVEELIRDSARRALAVLDQAADELAARHLRAPGMEKVAADPVLAAASTRAFRASISRWMTAVTENPLRPVQAAEDPETLQMARDLVRRGMEDSVQIAYRTGQVGAWQLCLRMVCSATDDVELVEQALELTAQSIGDFVDRTLAVVTDVMELEREVLLRGDSPERRAMVDLVLDGAPVAVDLASSRLGFDLARPHTAVVVWNAPGVPVSQSIESVVDVLLRQSETRRHVISLPSRDTAWLWLPGVALEPRALEVALRDMSSARVAIGVTDRGVEGFRASHRSALAVQRLISRSGLRQVARADDTRLAALLSRHGDEALDFVREVLGDLADAPTELLVTVRTYLEEIGSVTRTAERLFTHRNTVLRRITRADDLLPQPLRSHPLDVAAALELWQWLGGARGEDVVD